MTLNPARDRRHSVTAAGDDLFRFHFYGIGVCR